MRYWVPSTLNPVNSNQEPRGLSSRPLQLELPQSSETLLEPCNTLEFYQTGLQQGLQADDSHPGQGPAQNLGFSSGECVFLDSDSHGTQSV